MQRFVVLAVLFAVISCHKKYDNIYLNKNNKTVIKEKEEITLKPKVKIDTTDEETGKFYLDINSEQNTKINTSRELNNNSGEKSKNH